MEQLNRIELRGTVGGVRQLDISGNVLTRISLATNFAYKDREGNAVIDTSWHNIAAWRGHNIPDLSGLKKGDRLYVVGRVRYQKVSNDDGADRYYTEILANKIEVLPENDQFQYEML